MSSEYEIKKLFEWCTLLPLIDYPRKSPVLLLKGHECSFRLALEKQSGKWHYNLYVELKEGESQWKPCDVQIKIGFKKQTHLNFGEKTYTVAEYGIQEIWYTRKNDIELKLPADYLDGNCIKFQFYFKDVPGYILKTPLKRNDKSVQTVSYLNDDISIEGLPKDFSALLETEINHDAVLKCGENSIKVHRIVLSARSKVFKSMMQNDMKESRSGVVQIHDMDVGCVKDFVKYMYTDELPELTGEKAKKLYEVGDKYEVRSLMLRCAEYLQDILSPENAFQCFELADAHSDQPLQDKILTFMVSEKMYLQGESWANFCGRYPKAALEVYRLSYETNQGQ